MRITKRNIGHSARFHAADGNTYWATIVDVRRNGIRFRYDFTNEYGHVVQQIDACTPDQSKLEV